MLLNPLVQGDVISIKMISGEEVIARFQEQTDTHVTVTKPLVLIQGAKGMGLAPYVITVGKDTNINMTKSLMVVLAKTDSEMSAQYIEVTTGITLATENENCKIHSI